MKNLTYFYLSYFYLKNFFMLFNIFTKFHRNLRFDHGHSRLSWRVMTHMIFYFDNDITDNLTYDYIFTKISTQT